MCNASALRVYVLSAGKYPCVGCRQHDRSSAEFTAGRYGQIGGIPHLVLVFVLTVLFVALRFLARDSCIDFGIDAPNRVEMLHHSMLSFAPVPKGRGRGRFITEENSLKWACQRLVQAWTLRSLGTGLAPYFFMHRTRCLCTMHKYRRVRGSGLKAWVPSCSCLPGWSWWRPFYFLSKNPPSTQASTWRAYVASGLIGKSLHVVI